MSKSKKKPDNNLVVNKKARHNYIIDEVVQAGVALTGSEVKSLREKQGSLLEAYITQQRGEFFLQNCHIPEYKNGGYANHSPLRLRKLLLHRIEIDRLFGMVREKGYSLVPMRFYIVGRKIKLDFGLGKGKKKADKREALKEKADRKTMKEY